MVVLCRREQKSYLAPFIEAGLLFVPWFAATRMMTSVSSDNFWIPRPAFADVPKAVAYLLGGNAILCGLFGLGWIMLLAVLIRKKQWISPESFMLGVRPEERRHILLPLILSILGIILIHFR